MTKSLRIALYHNLHSGGAKRVVAEQIRYLAERHHVTVYSLESADHHFASVEDLPAVKMSLQSFEPVAFLPSPFGRLNPIVGLYNIHLLDRLARSMANLIDEDNYDVVLVHPCQFTQAPLLLRWLHTPTLYYCHELPRRLYESVETRTSKQASPLRQRLTKTIDRLDILPRLMRHWLRKIDIGCAVKATKITVNARTTQKNVWNIYGRQANICFPGVNVPQLYTAPSERQGFIITVGALTPNKGFDFILRALATIPAPARPPLLIVSNYQEAAESAFLATLARELGVQLEMRCNVSDTELQKCYQEAACVAYAPIREPLGLVALEAMAAGAPLVAVAEGGILETVVDGVSGLLAPRDPKIFGQTIQRVLQDSELATRLSHNGRRHVLENWTWMRHIEQLEQSLLQTIDRSLFRTSLIQRELVSL